MIDQVGTSVQQEYVLSLDGVSKSFGGVRAAKDVTVSLAPMETRVIIGPNGAGKSTLFNLITGELHVDAGKVTLFGSDITNAPIQSRIKLGLGRTYQTSNLFMEMTVRENLFLSAWKGSSSHGSVWSTLFKSWRSFPAQEKRIEEIAKQVGVEKVMDTVCGDLSHGEHRQVELGITLAHDPKILLLDEPLAGLSTTERIKMKQLIESVKTSITMVIIEHDIDTAFELADSVTVMDRGEIVATGTPKEIRENTLVQDIYTLSAAQG